MKILVIAAAYPHSGHLFSGNFNEKSVLALAELSSGVTVLAPRPYIPSLLSSLVPRWKVYTHIRAHEVRNGIPVYRPACPQLPRVAGAFWVDPGAFLWCHRVAKNLHRRTKFDAIISFDLLGAGGCAWRIGQALGIPASGWATGNDVRVPAASPYGRIVMRALNRLDIVFYQSRELLEKAAELLGISPLRMPPDRHVVLPRGIPEPPVLDKIAMRDQVRAGWGVTADQIVVLSVGRILRDKGVFELLDAVSLAAARDPRVTCMLVGSKPAFDETTSVKRWLNQRPELRERIRLLPACDPHKVWEYLCAADIFAFASHREGMPNSLLEAMAIGVPTIAFAIPPVLEIDTGTGSLHLVPPLDTAMFSEEILRLANSPDERRRIGERGKALAMDRFMVQKNMSAALSLLTQVVAKSS